MSIGDHCPVSVEIIEAIAKARDCDPMNMAPISRSFDLCALDTFDANSARPWSILFEFEDLFVTVRSDGTIYVDENSGASHGSQ